MYQPDKQVRSETTMKISLENLATHQDLAFLHLTPEDAQTYGAIWIKYEENPLGFPPPDSQTRETIESIVTWRDHSRVTKAEGRNLFVPMDIPYGAYDTLQIGGTSYKPFAEFDEERRFALTKTNQPILPPTTENILEEIPTLHDTVRVSPNGHLSPVRPAIRYVGGYLQQEAHEKFKATMTAAQWTDRPFLCPIPVAIGRYTRLRGQAGNIFFLVTSVPFKGLRVSDVLSNYIQHTSVDLDQTNEILSQSIWHLGESLRYMHDRGYAHMQPHFGNCFVWDNSFFIADFATLHKIEHEGAKAFDLYFAIRSAISCVTAITSGTYRIIRASRRNPTRYETNEAALKVFNEVLSLLFSGYTGTGISVKISADDAVRILSMYAVEGERGQYPGPAVIAVHSIMKQVLDRR